VRQRASHVTAYNYLETEVEQDAHHSASRNEHEPTTRDSVCSVPVAHINSRIPGQLAFNLPLVVTGRPRRSWCGTCHCLLKISYPRPRITVVARQFPLQPR
jgi:hypothetical protein